MKHSESFTTKRTKHTKKAFVLFACFVVSLLLAPGCEDSHKESSGASDNSAATAPAAVADPLPPGAVAWFGTPKCGGAVRVPGAVIKNLKVGASGLSYAWESGGCEALGATGPDDYSRTIACLGYQKSDGSWAFGKFDWISTSRRTRSFENVRSGYNGWDAAAFAAAKKHAFLICTPDGKKRTNYLFD